MSFYVAFWFSSGKKVVNLQRLSEYGSNLMLKPYSDFGRLHSENSLFSFQRSKPLVFTELEALNFKKSIWFVKYQKYQKLSTFNFNDPAPVKQANKTTAATVQRLYQFTTARRRERLESRAKTITGRKQFFK